MEFYNASDNLAREIIAQTQRKATFKASSKDEDDKLSKACSAVTKFKSMKSRADEFDTKIVTPLNHTYFTGETPRALISEVIYAADSIVVATLEPKEAISRLEKLNTEADKHLNKNLEKYQYNGGRCSRYDIKEYEGVKQYWIRLITV